MVFKNLDLTRFSRKQVIKNNQVYWIHRLILMFYILGLVLLGIGMLSKFDLDALLAYIILIAIFGWMLYLHYVAAYESVQGTTKGRNTSRFIALILLFLFPIGTVIALYLFYKTSDLEWQE